jgi:hypothetical protein
VLLGGVEVPAQTVRHLARLVGRPLSDKLESAIMFRSQVIGLSHNEKKAVLLALEKAPPELGELRQLLLASEAWRSVPAARH